jgi:monoamine oxidase
MRLACAANAPERPPVDELVEMARVSRRDFLKTSVLGAAALGSMGLWSGCATTGAGGKADPRIVIVGAGVSGLNAAHKLKQAGLRAEIYEASSRSGGRMYSATGLLAPGLVTELGGEFIDSNHEEMLALVKEFGLELLDVQAPGEEAYVREAYFFNGMHYTEAQVVEAFRPIAGRLQKDYDSLGEEVNFENDGGAKTLDNTSLAVYLDQIGASGWLRELLEVAFVTEYGLEAGEQSSLNMLFMISTDLSEGKFEVFGDSDERFKVVGGNQRVVDELAKRVQDQIHLGHRLLAVKSRGRGFTLSFEGPGGKTADVEAEIVLLTLPFTLLRDVEMGVELPAVKRKAIHELGYGMNAKLMLGFNRRVWRDLKQSGNIFSDEPFQLAWDNSRLQAGAAGGMTLFSGGSQGMAVGTGTPILQAKRLLPGVEKAFPGLAAAFNEKAERFHWPTFPWTKGSYACYRPGQWTSIAGAEIMPVGNLFFAGEHCSADFQGFMNGGAETGKTAAEEILGRLGRKRREMQRGAIRG